MAERASAHALGVRDRLGRGGFSGGLFEWVSDQALSGDGADVPGVVGTYLRVCELLLEKGIGFGDLEGYFGGHACEVRGGERCGSGPFSLRDPLELKSCGGEGLLQGRAGDSGVLDGKDRLRDGFDHVGGQGAFGRGEGRGGVHGYGCSVESDSVYSDAGKDALRPVNLLLGKVGGRGYGEGVLEASAVTPDTGRSAFRSLGDGAPVVVVRGQERGPNYRRNCANRLKQKLRRDAQRSRLPVVSPEEQNLRDLRVRRQTLQEERKLRKLESSVQGAEDAMAQVVLAQKCATMASDSRVAKWAEGLASASAESLARSSGASFSEVLVPGAGSRGLGSGSAGLGGSQGRVGALKGSAPRLSSGLPGGSVRSVDSVGVPYTLASARSWVRSYEYLEVHAAKGFKGRELAKAASISFGELEKYYRLKKEFGI